MAKKFVKFLGADVNFYGSDDPAKLVRGRSYEVAQEVKKGCKVFYALKGVEGLYNPYWFWERN